MMEEDARRHDPVYLEVLETLTRAWSQGKMVRLWHQRTDNTVNEYTFAPYVMEPYAVGQTAYVIGQCEACDGLRTFKVERIRRIELTANSYTIPEQFNLYTLLENAWGIWYTEEKPVMVKLRFHPRVAARVQETRWHRSEEVTPQEDGSLLWQAQIAAPQEMLPWIRGWGADVEVLEPEALRSQIAEELRRAAAQYIEGK
jgi:predicted DNA-binding transcriptional regulator YafY